MKHQITEEHWNIAYAEYQRTHKKPLSKLEWMTQLKAPVKLRRKYKSSVKTEARQGNRSWLSIQREYLRWRKTEDFAKWKRKQFLKQGGTCYYCDDPIYGIVNNVEHVIPKSRGGDNRKSNLVLACSQCNREKNTKLLSATEKAKLKKKNHPKKGTYTQTRSVYQTETDVALMISGWFRE